MTDYTVKRLALILAKQAEIEAMKTANEVRRSDNLAPVYPAESFMEASNELVELAYKQDHQL